MSRVMRLFVLTSLLVLALTPLPSSAQTGLATVTGLVTDNTGAAVPGVTVTATNQGTNVDYTGVSNEAGAYVITGVPIGTYVVRSELTGFKTVQSNVSLSAGQTARVDFKLEVGAVEERIEVAATGAVLQTENAVVGQTLQREQVEKLPIQGRNLATATLYAAGVTTPNPAVVQRPQEHRRRPSLRQRPARAGQQLHARRRRHERRHRQPDRLPAQPGRRRTGQRRDQQLLARARQRRRRGRQHGDQVGHQPLQRQRLLLLARQRHGGDAVGDQPRRRQEGGVQPQDLRRHDRRADRAEQAVLLRRLSGRAPEVAAGRRVPHRHPGRVAARRPEQPAQPRHADRRPRPADAASRSRTTRFPSSASATFARNLLANEALYPRANVTPRADRLPPELPSARSPPRRR